MPTPHVKPFSGSLPRKPFDENDPRALDLFPAWTEAKAPQYALVGVPFDGGVLGRKGAAGGPAAVREALRYSSSYSFEEDVDLHGMSTGDIGDITIASQDVAKTQQQVTESLASLWREGAQPLVLGGDNSITYAAVRALAQSVTGKVGILDFDAHLDVRAVGDAPSSGTPYRQILDELGPKVEPRNVAQMGLRRFANSKNYREWATKKGIRQFSMKEIRRSGFSGALESALQAATDGVEALYVSVDMDVVDQAWAPGVSSPSPDGLTPREVFDGVLAAGNRSMAKGFEVVETAPNLDPTGNTARVAAQCILHYLVGRKKPAWTPAPKSEAPPARPRPPPSGGMGGGPGRSFGGGGRGYPPRGPPDRGGPYRPPSRRW